MITKSRVLTILLVGSLLWSFSQSLLHASTQPFDLNGAEWIGLATVISGERMEEDGLYTYSVEIRRTLKGSWAPPEKLSFRSFSQLAIGVDVVLGAKRATNLVPGAVWPHSTATRQVFVLPVISSFLGDGRYFVALTGREKEYVRCGSRGVDYNYVGRNRLVTNYSFPSAFYSARTHLLDLAEFERCLGGPPSFP